LARFIDIVQHPLS
jgi:hypothetical protein